MEKILQKTIDDLQLKVKYLQNELKISEEVLNFIIVGKLSEAFVRIDQYKESTMYDIFTKLISRVNPGPNYTGIDDARTYIFLQIIIESMPFPVFIKDQDCRYIMLNKLEAELFSLEIDEIIGKKDDDFIQNPDEINLIRNSDQEVLNAKKSIELPKQNFSLPNGKAYIFKTHKIPFVNPITGKLNIHGFSIDITDTENLDKLKKVTIMASNPYV